MHAQRVRPVRRDRHVDHRIIEAKRFCSAHADLEVALQVDDAVMAVRDHQLALGTQHAGRLDATDGADFKVDAGARHVRARRRKDADKSGARVRRAAHHLHQPVFCLHVAHAQTVCVRVLAGFLDPAHGERRQRRRLVLDALDLEADADEAVTDFLDGGIRLEMLLEPLQRELHDRPPGRVGTLRAENP